MSVVRATQTSPTLVPGPDVKPELAEEDSDWELRAVAPDAGPVDVKAEVAADEKAVKYEQEPPESAVVEGATVNSGAPSTTAHNGAEPDVVADASTPWQHDLSEFDAIRARIRRQSELFKEKDERETRQMLDEMRARAAENRALEDQVRESRRLAGLTYVPRPQVIEATTLEEVIQVMQVCYEKYRREAGRSTTSSYKQS